MSHQILPEHIRASLAQYSEHQECTCLSCGYSGLMGVHRKEDKVSNKKAIIIFCVVMGILSLYSLQQQMKGQPIISFWFMLIVGCGIGAYWSRKQIYLACPNCNTELKVK
ncbi:hypothetical protein H3H36_15650 [Duganella sp. FT3S]|uniref:Uncharacterized protein n=1 Tax=Rugamonas fusca TaxID=2758568 RepID=A0A7W2EJ06_9BURK|nr:hypothetical protein [Rugamonas fusca]MBA5606791.1 hypothetical protein [Rugamonas fusca]